MSLLRKLSTYTISNIAQLAKQSLNVVIISRTQSKLEQVRKDIRTPRHVVLSDPAVAKYPKVEVRTLAIDFASTNPEIYTQIENELKGLDIGVLGMRSWTCASNIFHSRVRSVAYCCYSLALMRSLTFSQQCWRLLRLPSVLCRAQRTGSDLLVRPPCILFHVFWFILRPYAYVSVSIPLMSPLLV